MIQYISTLVGGTLEGDLSSLNLPIRDETLLIQCVSESESESENVHLVGSVRYYLSDQLGIMKLS